MSNMFGGGPQFGGQGFSGAAMNPMGQAMEVQEVNLAPGELVYATSLGASKSKKPRDRSQRRMPYMPGAWSWGESQGGPRQGRY